MDAERWDRIKDLFLDALDRPAEDRAAFLATATDDPAVHAEVEALLQAHHAEPSFLDAPIALALVGPPRGGEAPGTRIGPYVVLRELGRGGMGAVFLARRDDGTFDKHVALKIIRRGLDTEDILSRFHYERQILAALDHPHIATLHDGGMTDDGRPYFVMEYVDGLPITDYADAHRLSTDARLALFRTVCRAVQHAHQNLVIHRDLKPSNILVTDDGTVKLLDFGIAKLLSDEGLMMGQAAPRTRTGVRLMTPEYAAPEQVRGEAITTATDVYQLGVLLYELLTGQRPYRIEHRVEAEIARLILEAEPTRPSTAISATGPATAAARSTSVERLRRRLSGDLDNIVLKALSKEVARRYGTVEQLSEDIGRHRGGLPVTARSATVGYRVRKFVARHRWPVAVAVAVVAMLVSFGLFHTARVTAERDVARAEQQKAQAVAQFSASVLTAINPQAPTGGIVTALNLLDHSAQRAQIELRDQPPVQAKMMGVMGSAYRVWGQFDKADTLLTQALAIHEAPGTPPTADYAEALTTLSQLRLDQGAYEAADTLLHQAERLMRQIHGPHHAKLAWIFLGQGVTQETLGNPEAAEPLYRASIALYRALPGEPDADEGAALNYLARLLRDRRAYDEAEALNREALALFRTIHGEAPHADIAWTLSDLGVLLTKKAAYEQAEPLLREALALHHAIYGELHPEYFFALYNLVMCQFARGAHHKAVPLLRHVLAQHRESDPGSLLTARTAVLLGEGLTGTAQYAEAERLLTESLPTLLASFGPTNSRTHQALRSLAALYDAWGKPEEAARTRARLAGLTEPSGS